MTKEERDRRVDEILGRYEALGATVVSDEETLCRLLESLGAVDSDQQVGRYVSAYLGA